MGRPARVHFRHGPHSPTLPCGAVNHPDNLGTHRPEEVTCQICLSAIHPHPSPRKETR